jgi:hypothetical protein
MGLAEADDEQRAVLEQAHDLIRRQRLRLVEDDGDYDAVTAESPRKTHRNRTGKQTDGCSVNGGVRSGRFQGDRAPVPFEVTFRNGRQGHMTGYESSS